MTDTQTPERIWAWQGTDPLTDKKWGAGEWYTEDVGLDGDEVEFVRADLHAAVVAERDQLRGQVEQLCNEVRFFPHGLELSEHIRWRTKALEKYDG